MFFSTSSSSSKSSSSSSSVFVTIVSHKNLEVEKFLEIFFLFFFPMCPCSFMKIFLCFTRKKKFRKYSTRELFSLKEEKKKKNREKKC